MISAIWAMDKNWLIGKDNELPWHYSEDLKYFKKITNKKTVLMGKNTFVSILDSLGKPLPNRKNIVCSRSNYKYEGVEIVSDVDEYLKENKEEIFIIGGSNIYEKTIKYCDRLYITHIDKEFEGNIYFKKIDLNKFTLVSSEKIGELTFAIYERK